jgi:hypothetical protein
VGAVRVQYTSNKAGRDQPAGGARGLKWVCGVVCLSPKESQFVGCKPTTTHPCAPRALTGASSLWLACLLSSSLQEQLDQKLQQRQARETGICPIREELYAQCFGTCVALASP